MATKIYESEDRDIVLGDTKIRYKLTRKQVKNINLRIDAAGNVKVSAARHVPVNYIEAFMMQKQELIVEAVERARQDNIQKEKEQRPSRQYNDGEVLTLLGNKFEIKTRIIKSEAECICLDDGYLYFKVRNPEDTRHKKLLYDEWLKAYRCKVYEDICRRVYEIFRQYGVDYPEIKVRCMTSRWGSCQPYKGIVTFNSRLIETPVCCIEYVVMHEFCHFIHPNHSKEFHALMTNFMPDWKQRKKQLNAITEWN